jgi:hypothetical protein
MKTNTTASSKAGPSRSQEKALRTTILKGKDLEKDYDISPTEQFGVYTVTAKNGKSSYTVNLNAGTCNCEMGTNNPTCKHRQGVARLFIRAAKFISNPLATPEYMSHVETQTLFQ